MLGNRPPGVAKIQGEPARMGLSPPASLQSWANSQVYRFEKGSQHWPSWHGSGAEGRGPGPLAQEALCPPPRVLAPTAPVDGSSYLLELLVDDFVNLV